MKPPRRVTLPEPSAVREVHAWRRKIQRRAEKIGWARYLEELNARPSLFPKAEPMVLRDRPARDYGSK